MINVSNQTKNKLIKSIVFLFVFLILIMPVISFSAGLVPACALIKPSDPNSECVWGWDQFLQLINNVVHFILFYLALPIAAIMFAYAGFVMVTSGGDPGKKSTAKSIFTNVSIGLIIAVSSWLIVELVITLLGYNGKWIGF